MSRFGDNWAVAHRNTSAGAAVVGLVAVLVWARCSGPGDLVETQRESAVVERVVGPQGALDEARPVCLLRLEDGRQVRLQVGPPPPEVGDSVPVEVETYADGSRRAYLDLERWRGY